MGKVLAVTSGKGGVGKSTVSVGLGLAFAKMGKKTLLVDMDEGLRCLDLMLGIDESIVFDLSDIIKTFEVDDAVYPCSLCDGLYLIPAPAKRDNIDAFSFTKLASELSENYDIVIFDFPAGIDVSLYSCLPKETLFLTVAVPDPVSIRDAAMMGNQLANMQLKSRLIINRFIYKQSAKHKFKNVDEIIDTSLIQLVGIIPESNELSMFTTKHKLKKKGNAALAFKRVAERLDGKRVLLPNLKKI